uniref:Uncharacterized protein n=1 Tax=Arundo donax TaxID=35708 RepID=A0A0A8XPB4_ARUDO
MGDTCACEISGKGISGPDLWDEGGRRSAWADQADNGRRADGRILDDGGGGVR